jgi:hypothetical protein
MGLELSAFLSVYASVMAGNLTACSIGGKPNNGGLLGGLGSTLGLIGEPQFLQNVCQCDASPHGHYIVSIANGLQWGSSLPRHVSI